MPYSTERRILDLLSPQPAGSYTPEVISDYPLPIHTDPRDKHEHLQPQFQIPDFQRGPSWDRSLVQPKLEHLLSMGSRFPDLESQVNSHPSDYNTYYNQLILWAPEESINPGHQIFYVVDGQQRLTFVSATLREIQRRGIELIKQGHECKLEILGNDGEITTLLPQDLDHYLFDADVAKQQQGSTRMILRRHPTHIENFQATEADDNTIYRAALISNSFAGPIKPMWLTVHEFIKEMTPEQLSALWRGVQGLQVTTTILHPEEDGREHFQSNRGGVSLTNEDMARNLLLRPDPNGIKAGSSPNATSVTSAGVDLQSWQTISEMSGRCPGGFNTVLQCYLEREIEDASGAIPTGQLYNMLHKLITRKSQSMGNSSATSHVMEGLKNQALMQAYAMHGPSEPIEELQKWRTYMGINARKSFISFATAAKSHGKVINEEQTIWRDDTNMQAYSGLMAAARMHLKKPWDDVQWCQNSLMNNHQVSPELVHQTHARYELVKKAYINLIKTINIITVRRIMAYDNRVTAGFNNLFPAVVREICSMSIDDEHSLSNLLIEKFDGSSDTLTIPNDNMCLQNMLNRPANRKQGIGLLVKLLKHSRGLASISQEDREAWLQSLINDENASIQIDHIGNVAPCDDQKKKLGAQALSEYVEVKDFLGNLTLTETRHNGAMRNNHPFKKNKKGYSQEPHNPLAVDASQHLNRLENQDGDWDKAEVLTRTRRLVTELLYLFPRPAKAAQLNRNADHGVAAQKALNPEDMAVVVKDKPKKRQPTNPSKAASAAGNSKQKNANRLSNKVNPDQAPEEATLAN